MAGVSLRLVAGEEGILGRTENAVDKSNIATLKEEIELEISEARIAYYDGEKESGAISADDNIVKKLQNGIKTSKGTVELVGENLQIAETVIGRYSTENGLVINNMPTGENADVVGSSKDWEITAEGKIFLYKGKIPESGVVTIPNIVDGKKVNSIGWKHTVNNCPVSIFYEGEVMDYAYYNRTIKEVRITDGILKIEYGALCGMTVLEKVYIPASVTEINNLNYACPKLTTIHYAGTKEQWNLITGKPDDLQIVCSNGIINP